MSRACKLITATDEAHILELQRLYVEPGAFGHLVERLDNDM